MISNVFESFAAFAIASATPECTVPTSTSTWSRLISLLTLSVAFDGSDSSSTLKYWISRPPSLPPCSWHVELEAALDHVAERRVGAAVRQHQADLDRAAGLRVRAEPDTRKQGGGGRSGQKMGGRHRVSPFQVDGCSRMKRPASLMRSSG
jgi:hypothetical protein